MTPAILLVDHGSRRAEANTLLEHVAERVRKRAAHCVVRTAHLELAHPTIAEGIDACADAGASEIVVQPYFLGPGNHTARDIPRLVTEAMQHHRELRVRIAEPLGLHDGLIDAIMDRVEAAQG